ncbi:hypothetical protein MNBD_GAMMA09-2158 [hydrothermal vent metagenome]|uniref:Sulfotransferase n=1 Tax=hydrothermal vent metagenome TaxID=652676 RepID=A0A3B0Y4J3_9ZZZZ
MIETLLRIPEKALFTLLGQLENTLSRNHKLQNTPTFIIGPPRSGTTLLGQIVCHAFDVSYIPNMAIRMRHIYNGYPPIVTASKIAKLLGYTSNTDEKYESYYGSSSVLGGSSDSDFIWRDVLPMGYLEKGDLSDQHQRYIHRITAGLEKVFNKPFIDKCVGHSLRIPALLEIFPEALFIRCKRNPLAVAQSVYFGRTRSEWTRKTWLTPHARGYEALFQKDLLEQCAGQQYLFEKDIDAGLSQVDPERVIEVDYDDVCRQPEKELQRIYDLMHQHNIEVQMLHKAPDAFPLSNFRRVDKNIYNQLVTHLEKIYGTPVSHLYEQSDQEKNN